MGLTHVHCIQILVETLGVRAPELYILARDCVPRTRNFRNIFLLEAIAKIRDSKVVGIAS